MVRATKRRGVRPAAVLPGVLTIAMAVSGCATGDVETAPAAGSATTPAAALDGESVSGTGPTGFPGVDFEIPAGARSVVIAFDCEGGGAFSVELGDSMMLGQAPAGGTCDGTQQLSWPVTEQTGPTLSVTVGEGVTWTASPTFSDAEFARDDALAADCDRFSEIHSALINADTGYTHYGAFPASEWETRVDEATADLDALAAAAQSELGTAFAELKGIVDDPDRAVGAVLNGTEEPVGVIILACNANQTPVITHAEFGG